MKRNLYLLFLAFFVLGFASRSNAQCDTITGETHVCANGGTITLTDLTPGGTWISSSTLIATVTVLSPTQAVVYGVSAGVATIDYSGDSLCGATLHIVTVNAAPGAITASSSSICVGALDTVTDATTGGTWSLSSTTIATISGGGGSSAGAVVKGLSDGIDTVRYTNTSGCRASHVVTVHGPSAITPHSPTLCSGSTLTLTDAVTGGSWFSSSTSLATVGSSSGVVSGVAAGAVIISYFQSSCLVRDTVTVNNGAGTISPTSPITLCIGSGVTLSDATAGGTWSTTNSTVATITPVPPVATAVGNGIDTIKYTVTSGCFATKVITVSSPSALSPVDPSICVGSTVTLVESVTGGSWGSDNTAVATVSSGGIVHGASAGSAIISYNFGSSLCTVYDTVFVTSGAGVITPSPASVCAGSDIFLTETVSGGTWVSTNTAVATVVLVGPATGTVTGAIAGTTTIIYFVGSCSTSTVVTVSNPPGLISGNNHPCAGTLDTLTESVGGTWASSNTSVATVAISSGIVSVLSPGTSMITFYVSPGCSTGDELFVSAPPSAITPSGTSVTCVGQSVTLSETTTGGTWTSSNTAVATLTNAGTTTSVNGVSGGTAIITYTVGSCFVTKIVTVIASSPISPLTSSVCEGGTETLTEPALTPPLTGVWSSGTTSIATVVATSGVVSGVLPGTDIITYQIFNGSSAVCAAYTATVNVTAGAGTITPTGTVTVCSGASTTLIDATTGGTWSSLSTTVATVSSSGVVYGVSGGSATIDYSTGTCSVSKFVTVTQGPAAISPSSTAICSGTTTTLIDGSTGGVWSSNNTSVATVSTGTVGGVAHGTATISYTVGTCSSTAAVTVNTTPAAITPSGALTLCSAATTTLTDGVSGGVWTSNNALVATVSSGVVSGVSAGTATISYSIGSCFATKVVTVVSGPAAILPSSPTVCTGTTLPLTETTSGGTWSSSATGTATVSASGVVSGVTAGTTTIAYLSGSCTATTTVTVVNSPAAISPSAPVIFCEGSTTTLTDGTTGGAWSSGATGVATVSSAGIVSGIVPGTATISYTVGICSVSKVVTVSTGPAALLPSSPTVCTGGTLTLTDAVSGGTWSSSLTSTATVSTSGTVSGVGAGTVNIYYIIGSCVATASVTVTAAPGVGTISGTTALCVGSTTPLSDAATGGAWSSNNTAVATVSAAGLVFGVSTGTATISYSNTSSCGVIAATHVVTVNTTPTAGTITGPSSICAGTTASLSNTVTPGTWTASNGSVSVNLTTGLITGISPGTDTITYKVITPCGIATTTVAVTVGTFLSAGTISGGTSLCGGTTISLTEAGGTGGVWSSSNSSATVSSTGVVTGAPAGGADTILYTVSASCGSAVASHIITVNPAPDAGSISGITSVCTGTFTDLAETVTDGTWSASNSNATVTSSGVVTAVSPGTDVISYSVTNGCGTAVSSVTVTISASVTAGTISGPGGVCPGSPVTLTESVSGGVWSSSGGATVSSGGLVTGVSAGAATISYTVASSCGTAIATFPMSVSSTSLTAGSIIGVSALCVGSYTLFTDLAGDGVWSSSNSNVTVTSGGVVTGISTGTSIVTYTVSNSCGTVTATQEVTISGLLTAGAISGVGNVCIGFPVTLTESISGGVWSTSNSHGSVSSSGVVTGITAGLDTVNYTVTNGCGTATASFDMSVNSTAPSPGSIIGGSGVCIGYPVLYTNPISGGTWSISNSHATISSSGLVSGVSSGTDTIRYTVSTPCGIGATTKIITIGSSPGVAAITGASVVCTGYWIPLADATSSGVWSSSSTGNATVSSTGVVNGVTTGTAVISYSVTYSCGVASVLKNITINPSSGIASISGLDSVCLGAAITLSESTSGGVWSSGNTNASVSSGGVVTGLAAGAAPISYTISGTSCGNISAVSNVIIEAGPSSGIGPISSLSIVCVGSGITLTDPTPGGTWVASNGHAIVVGAGIIDGVSPGIDTIAYIVTGTCGSGEVTKILSVDTIPVVLPIVGPASQCVGTTITLSDPITGGIWTTSTPSVGTVTVSTGVVTGLSSGVTTITYTVTNLFGCPGSITSNDVVTPPSLLTGITGTASVCVASSVTLSDATTGGAWSSGNTAVAVIDPVSGSVTGVSPGTAMISYTVTNSCGTSSVASIETVSGLPAVAPISGAATGCVGSPVMLGDATASGVWSSSNTAIATVNASGAVTGVTSGAVTINYTVTNIFGCSVSATTSVFINPAPSVAGITGTPSECAGSTTVLADATGGGAWTSSNTAIATVNAFGTVSGIVPGTVTISYIISGSGCPGIATVTDVVNTIPVESPITGVLHVCAGATTPLGNSIGGGVWSSAHTSIAIIGATSGIVTGMSGGTDEIYYSVSNSCGSAVDSAAITVYAGPAIGAISAAYTVVCTGNALDVSDAVTGGIWGSTNTAIATVNSAGVVTSLSAGTDTIYYVVTNSGGCSSSAMITITVGGAITTATVAPVGTVELCRGHTETMHVTSGGGVTYQWMRNSSVITGATAASYTTSANGNYSVIVSNGICSETVAGPSLITPPVPVVSFTAPNILYAGTFSSYQWYRNGVLITGATSSILDETGGGAYTVVVTDAGGCSDTSLAYTVGGPSTGVNNQNAAQQIKVYPNPATAVVHIDAPVKVNISVLSIDGKVLIDQKAATDIDVSQLADGMYLIMIYDENNILLKTTKFAKAE